MMRSTRIRFRSMTAGCLAAAALGWSAAGRADPYADPTKVNLMRRVDLDGNLIVTGAWVNINNGGGAPGFYNVIDAGVWHSQVNFSSKDTNNQAAIRITLPEAMPVGVFRHSYSSHRAEYYRLLVSTNGFGSLTEAVPWTAVSAGDGPYSVTLNQTVRFFQLEFRGTTPDKYLIVKEVQAYPPAGTVIQDTAGYNLFAQRATAGPITDITGTWNDAVNNILDLNIESYLRAGSSAQHSFVITLNGKYRLRGMGVGFYVSQYWTDSVKFEVTADETYGGGTVWTTVYEQSTPLGSATIPFSGSFDARYIRVTLNYPGSNSGALCELEVYAVPPPEATELYVE